MLTETTELIKFCLFKMIKEFYPSTSPELLSKWPCSISWILFLSRHVQIYTNVRIKLCWTIRAFSLNLWYFKCYPKCALQSLLSQKSIKAIQCTLLSTIRWNVLCCWGFAYLQKKRIEQARYNSIRILLTIKYENNSISNRVFRRGSDHSK